MVKSRTGSSPFTPHGHPFFLRVMLNTLRIVFALASAGAGASSSDTPTGTTSGASDVVAVNQGLLVTGSVHFGAVPVPNLCVELRGYERPAATEDAPPTKAGDGSSDAAAAAAAAAATATGERALRGWEEGEPRFLQLGRTGASDGSFAFVTPESGVILVLAAYSHDGDHPAAVRVFTDDDDDAGSGSADRLKAARHGGGGGSGVGRGGAPAVGVGSGRIQVHIDLLADGDVRSPEELWGRAAAAAAAAARANDRSPCAREEAASGDGGGGGADATGGGSGAAGRSGAAMADPDGVPAARKPDSFVDGFMCALLALRRWSFGAFSQIGAGLWKANAAACAMLSSGLETAGHFLHGSAAEEPQSLLSVWLKQASAQTRTWSEQKWASLSTWIGQRSTQSSAWFVRNPSFFSAGLGRSVPHFASWWREAQAWMFPYLNEFGLFDLGGWWTVWWVRVGCIALLFSVLQQAFSFTTRGSSRTTGVDREDSDTIGDTPSCESPLQDPGPAVTDSMVATVHNSDGTVSQLDFAALDRPAAPATIEKKRKGVLASMWGGGRSGPAEETQGGGGEEEGPDEFSSMFRALSQPACNVSPPTVGAGGSANNFVVVTQQSWAQEARDSQDY